MFLLSQPSILRSTPRWERWNSDVNGYLCYRRGLRIERGNGEPTRPLATYRQALAYFDRAANIDPANMLVQLHRASLLELIGKPDEAVKTYRWCTTLWPEHIEVLYRLGTSYKNAAGGANSEVAAAPLLEIRDRLKLTSLLRAWLLTWRLGHWNPGERRYWRSWISLRLWDRVNKRTAYLRAVEVAELVVELSFLPLERNGGGTSGVGAASGAHSVVRDPEGQAKVKTLLEKLAALLLRPDRAPAADRLLHPSAKEQPYLMADSAHTPAYGGRHYRRRPTGWLALFNAACFFSLAISLSEECIPGGFSREEWKLCCARASIHELGLIHRDPRNTLDPQWMWRDPDLAPLRETETGRAWQSFLGMPASPQPQNSAIAPLKVKGSLLRSAIAQRYAAQLRRRK
jgi:tetratricopeptide (TPR) repeat protein